MMGVAQAAHAPSIVALMIALSLMSIESRAEGEASLDEARISFERGQEMERRGNLAGALEAYQRAEEIRPTYRLHRHIGRVFRGLGRYVEALHRFERFLEEGGERITSEQRQWVAEANAELQQEIASLQLSVPEGAEVLLDGRSVGRSPLIDSLNLDPGHHVVEVRLEGHSDLRRELEIESGEVRTLEVLLSSFEPDGEDPINAPMVAPDEVEPSTPESTTAFNEGTPTTEEPSPPSRRRIHRAVFYSILGLSAATLGSSIVFGGLTVSEHRDFEVMNVAQRTASEDTFLRESGRRGEAFALASDVLLITGATLAVTTLILGFLTDFSGTTPDNQGEAVQISIVPLGRQR